MIKYNNIEKLQLPNIQSIFFPPVDYNSPPLGGYGWWSPLSQLNWTSVSLKDVGFYDQSWITKTLKDEIEDLDLRCWSGKVGEPYIEFNGIKYSDLEFLIRFEWDEGDRSVGIWPGYNVSLILNNEKPVYRTFDYVEEENP